MVQIFKEIGQLSNEEISEMVKKEMFKKIAGNIPTAEMIVDFRIEPCDGVDELIAARVLVEKETN